MENQSLSSFDDRSELLLGDDFKYLGKAKVAVCGIGGVGSIIPLALIRSGIKNFVLVDFDQVDASNLNRQFAYGPNDIGKNKVDVMKANLLSLRKEAVIYTYFGRIDEKFDFNILNDCDYVFDCIDDIKAKVMLIKYCQDKNIKIVSSLGMGNRLDSTKVSITRLNKTTDDPLARKLRHDLKENGVDISRVVVSFSNEQPIIRGRKISSMVFVPNSSGLALASYALGEIIKMKKDER